MGIFGGISDFFGLDIGTTAVRVVQLRGKGSNKTVFRYGKIPLQQSANKSDVDSLAQLANTIRELLVQSQVTTRNVVMGLPNTDVYSTVKEFESMKPADLDKTIQFQMDLIIPKGAQDSKIDYAVLNSEVKDAEKTDVFFCSVKNDFAQRRLELLESINLNVLAFEPDGIALVRAVSNSNSGQANLIVDVGFNNSDIVITYNNQPRLITSVPVGVSHIIKSVVNSLHVGQDEGQQLIFQTGFQGGQEHQAVGIAIAQTLDVLLIQIKKSISFFINRHPQGNLSQIILCGDVVYIPGLSEFLAQQSNLSVAVGDAWQNVVCPQPLHEELKGLSVNFTVAAGLAERQAI